MNTQVHRPGYQRRDREVVDYQEYELPGTGLSFRGPDPGPLTTGDHVTFLGAAQTFGCFTDRPFPTQVGTALGRDVRNLGYGGAGPRFYLEHRELIDEANRGAAAVVQVMSARSEDNRLYRSGGLEFLERRSDGSRIGANDAYTALVRGHDPVTGRPRSRPARLVTSRVNRPRLRRLVAETRANWVANHRLLLAAIEVPTVLLWFSTRRPDYVTRYRTTSGLFGAFPQFVNEEMMEAVRPFAAATVEVVSNAGLPQPLVSRFNGRPTTVDPADDRPDLGGSSWTHNRYYPSPEMHDEAASAVATALGEIGVR